MISDERLRKIQHDLECWQQDYDAVFDAENHRLMGDAASAITELLTLRKPFTQPIAWIHQTTGAMLKNSVIEEVRKQSCVWIPLYRKPTDSTT
ncbi:MULTISPECIES: hypothetical protein [unclassified Pantoea]|uniref:hypothetical protein n=1 Tax=unclassified Pantoea TaxID=2630326 RepID=UPI001CD7B623|nr:MULTISPECIES: hypothetical protein [unclassified Pantoea]MCA1178919.1 hypothetical protein [Pantoea sp. alder69]MCA1253631.1 hypothetical protein [Pantoea sp. alder70]MCA1267408.1 hypothetical protein [Pantoea sp. alder81]